MKINTYLPLFKGFYGSILDDIEDHNEASKLFTQAVNQWLNDDIKVDLKFQKLQRPRFYNFSNDEIHVELSISKKEIKRLFDIGLTEYRPEFENYIKDRFTSCEGFASFYSNTLAGWERYTYEFYDYEEKKQSNILSSLMDFYLSMICEYTEDDLMEYATFNGAEIVEYY